MKIRIYSLLLCGFALGSLSALAQQSPLLEKYRTMALDYNHDLKAAEKNIAASMEVEKSARADLKPKLSGTANFQYTENPLELTLDVFFRIIKNSGRETTELWWFSFHSATGLYRRTSTGIHPYGTTSAIICCQSGKGIE